MESNDRLNWGDDSEIEKIIPLDKGIDSTRFLTRNRASFVQWHCSEDQQVEFEEWAHFSPHN